MDTIIFIPIIDCSEGMAGEKMDERNDAMEDLACILREVQRVNDEADDGDGDSYHAEIRWAPILFATGARWMSKHIFFPMGGFWVSQSAGGHADFGAALKFLSEKLTLESEGGLFRWDERLRARGRYGRHEYLVPVLFSGTRATDDYRAELNKLKENKFFRKSRRWAIPIGPDADREMLIDFTGGEEYVIDLRTFVYNVDSFLYSVSLKDRVVIDYDEESDETVNMMKTMSTMLVIPIIDCSDGMAGEKKSMLDDAMGEIVTLLRLTDEDNDDDTHPLEIKFAPIVFSTGARWIPQDIVYPFQDYWVSQSAGGHADFGAALKALSEKLTTESEGGWIQRDGRREYPVFLLFSGTPATDDYRAELNKLKENKFFQKADRIAVSIGPDADREMLTGFAGEAGTVVDIRDFVYRIDDILHAPLSRYRWTIELDENIGGPFDDDIDEW